MLKYFYIDRLLGQLAITMPKYSALLFYVRVFGVKGNLGLFRINLLAAVGFVTAWLLFVLPFNAFNCTPVRKAWLPLATGHCLDTSPWYLGILALSVIIDVYSMLLPVPILWSLHARRRRKLILTEFFFCAYCVITCSLGRLVAFFQIDKKFEWDFT